MKRRAGDGQMVEPKKPCLSPLPPHCGRKGRLRLSTHIREHASHVLLGSRLFAAAWAAASSSFLSISSKASLLSTQRSWISWTSCIADSLRMATCHMVSFVPSAPPNTYPPARSITRSICIMLFLFSTASTFEAHQTEAIHHVCDGLVETTKLLVSEHWRLLLQNGRQVRQVLDLGVKFEVER